MTNTKTKLLNNWYQIKHQWFEKMFKNRFLLLMSCVFLIVATVSFAYKGTLITKEPSLIFFSIGKYYFNHNDYHNAIKYFKKSVELKPDFAGAYHNLGISFYYNGNINEAINYLKKSIEIKKDYAKAHYSIALIYYELRDFDNAAHHLSMVVQLEPNNANAHFDLAVAYADGFRKKESSGNVALSDLEGLKEALKHYRKAEELKPLFPNALSNTKIVENVIVEYEKFLIVD